MWIRRLEVWNTREHEGMRSCFNGASQMDDGAKGDRAPLAKTWPHRRHVELGPELRSVLSDECCKSQPQVSGQWCIRWSTKEASILMLQRVNQKCPNPESRRLGAKSRSGNLAGQSLGGRGTKAGRDVVQLRCLRAMWAFLSQPPTSHVTRPTGPPSPNLPLSWHSSRLRLVIL